MGLWQMAHCSVARSWCLAQNLEAGAGAVADVSTGGAAATDTLRRPAPEDWGGGGGAVAATGTGAEGTAAGAWLPNSCRTSWFTNSEASSPQLGQMNFTGCVSISGVASKAYLAPQEHWSFMMCWS